MCLQKHKPKGGHHTGKGRWPCHHTGNASHTYSQKNPLQARKAWNACSIMYKIIGGLLPGCNFNYSTEIMAGMKQTVLKYFQITWSDLCKNNQHMHVCNAVCICASTCNKPSNQKQRKQEKKKKKNIKDILLLYYQLQFILFFFFNWKGVPS